MIVDSHSVKRIILAVAVSMPVVPSIQAETNPVSKISRDYRLDSYSDVKIMVHYMPWYQALPVSGYWGWHWTMDHFNPNNMDDSGRREIASHHYPLTGPYDSQDEDILEYQVLLMYGIEDFWDYGVINQSTQAIFEKIKRAGLLFSICYEDQTIGHMVENNHLAADDVYIHGQTVMLYLQNTWFLDEAYLKLSDKPVLLTFGPQHFYQSSEWDTLFSVLDTRPSLFTLNNRLAPIAAGAFPWPPMWASDGGVLSETALNNYLSSFYENARIWDYLVAGAFPGFHDIYSEAGLGFTYGYLDPQNGAIFDNTLRMALKNSPDIIQIVTWNDYGEGTIIEPTLEFGYQYLEMIQSARRDSIDPEFPYTSDDLEIPLQLFSLRNIYENDNEVNAILDSVFALIIAGNLQLATEMINSIGSLDNTAARSAGKPEQPHLSNSYPNPFNSATTLHFDFPVATQTTLIIHDILGREVARLVDGMQPTGYHQAFWNGQDHVGQAVPSGIYIARLVTPEYTKSIKMVLLK